MQVKLKPDDAFSPEGIASFVHVVDPGATEKITGELDASVPYA
jgi:hypothetical protein